MDIPRKRQRLLKDYWIQIDLKYVFISPRGPNKPSHHFMAAATLNKRFRKARTGIDPHEKLRKMEVLTTAIMYCSS